MTEATLREGSKSRRATARFVPRLHIVMVVICLGPVCVPMSAFVPFCVGMLHQYGYLKWVKQEWFTWRWLKPRLKVALGMRVSDEELAATAAKTAEAPKKQA